MTINRAATAAGKKFETDLMKHLREQGLDVERLRLSGAEDEGDLLVRHGDYRYVIEAKRTKSLDLGGWVKEAQVERDQFAAHRGLVNPLPRFVVVHYARNKNISQSYVTTTLSEWLGHL